MCSSAPDRPPPPPNREAQAGGAAPRRRPKFVGSLCPCAAARRAAACTCLVMALLNDPVARFMCACVCVRKCPCLPHLLTAATCSPAGYECSGQQAGGTWRSVHGCFLATTHSPLATSAAGAPLAPGSGSAIEGAPGPRPFRRARLVRPLPPHTARAHALHAACLKLPWRAAGSPANPPEPAPLLERAHSPPGFLGRSHLHAPGALAAGRRGTTKPRSLRCAHAPPPRQFARHHSPSPPPLLRPGALTSLSQSRKIRLFCFAQFCFVLWSGNALSRRAREW